VNLRHCTYKQLLVLKLLLFFRQKVFLFLIHIHLLLLLLQRQIPHYHLLLHNGSVTISLTILLKTILLLHIYYDLSSINSWTL